MNDVKVDGQQIARSLADEFVPGEYWTHYKGGVYQLVALGVFENTGELMVTYKSLKYSTIWVRTLHNFTETVKLPTGEVPRFKRGAP